MRTRPFPLLLGALLIGSSLSSFAASIIISDEDFANSSWIVIVNQLTPGESQTATQSLTGGNSDAFRSMTHGFSGSGTLSVFHQYNDSAYTPATAGAILSLDYSEDQIQFNPPFSGAQIGATPALLQDGIVYVGPGINFSSTSWAAASLAGLTAADFTAFGGSANPDFSETGSAIHFGFQRFNSTGGVVSETQHGIDNWSVTLETNSVPDTESAWALLGLGLGCCAFFAHRQVERV